MVRAMTMMMNKARGTSKQIITYIRDWNWRRSGIESVAGVSNTYSSKAELIGAYGVYARDEKSTRRGLMSADGHQFFKDGITISRDDSLSNYKRSLSTAAGMKRVYKVNSVSLEYNIYIINIYSLFKK